MTDGDKGLSQQQLMTAGIPRRYWNVAEKESKRPAIAAIIDNIENHFVAGDNFRLVGKDFSTRLAVASYICIRVGQLGNRFFRDKWSSEKPTEPHSKTVPYSVRFADPQTLIDLNHEETYRGFIWQPDLFVLGELGAGWESSLYQRVVDDFLRLRFTGALITVVTLAEELDVGKYAATTRDILSQFKEVAL